MHLCVCVCVWPQLGGGKGLGAQKLSRSFSEIEKQVEQREKEEKEAAAQFAQHNQQHLGDGGRQEQTRGAGGSWSQ